MEEDSEIDSNEFNKDKDDSPTNGCDQDIDSHRDSLEPDEDIVIRNHPSYEQVMLDVNRCAGRLEHIRQVYFHRTDADDGDELPEDLTEDLQKLKEEADEEKNDLLNSETRGVEDRDSLGEDVLRERSARIKKDLHNQRELKRKLAKLIVKLLIKKPEIHYYQGFHDVCLTYMTILGEEEAYSKLDNLTDSHFGLFMRPTMNETQEFLALIPIIVGLEDHKLSKFLDQSEVGTIFALSWVITWFSHVIPDERDVERLFRFLEGHDPLMILYLCAAIVIYKKKQLLQLTPEMSAVHQFLSQVPRKEKLPLDELITTATGLFVKWPSEYVKRELDDHRRAKLQLYNYNIIQNLAYRFGPVISTIVAPSARKAIIVLVVASAIALQLDRWMR